MERILAASPAVDRKLLLTLRLSTLMMTVVLLTLHIRSVRVFKWEQLVSGGLLCTYCIICVGLAIIAGADIGGVKTLEAYFTGIGAVMFAINAIKIWLLWRSAGELTLVVVELLQTLGVRLRRQIMCKVFLSFLVSIALAIDVAFVPLLVMTTTLNKEEELNLTR